MGRELSDEGHVVKACDAEHRLVNAVAFETAVPQDLPVLQAGQRMLNAGAGLAVHVVLGFLLRSQVFLAASAAVWNQQAGPLVSAVGDRGDASASGIDAGFGVGPAVVAAAGQRIADGHHQAAVGIDDDLQVSGLPRCDVRAVDLPGCGGGAYRARAR